MNDRLPTALAIINGEYTGPKKVGPFFIGNWYETREEAWKVAEAAGQILYRCGGDTRNGGTLYSENLY